MREHTTVQPWFLETYHYADVITAAIEERFDHLGIWDEFFCDGQVAGLIAPYSRTSAFHAFIGFVIDQLLYDYTVDVDLDHRQSVAKAIGEIAEPIADVEPFTLPVERAFKVRGFEFESFVDWLKGRNKTFAVADGDDLYDYFQALRLYETYDDLVARSTREVFFILFGNRRLLLAFNAIVSNHVESEVLDAVDEELRAHATPLFDRPGVLKRAHMPQWVRRAVYFRDRGRCVMCQTDLSGILSMWSEDNFDHMVPLASGGLNDVTNIQLLCATCNQRKADGASVTSGTYEDWYSMDEPPNKRNT